VQALTLLHREASARHSIWLDIHTFDGDKTMVTPRHDAKANDLPAVAHGAKTLTTGSTASLDAIELLKADHRQVEGWFADFEASDSRAEKEELAAAICQALTVHTQIEEEIFYPAFLDATGDDAMYDEAVEDHDEAGELIAEIEGADGAELQQLEGQIHELAALIKDHVQEEERPDGMFDRAQKSDLDLFEVGAQLERRKLELMDDSTTDEGYDEAVNASESEDELDGELEDNEDDDSESSADNAGR
jgi:hemerythrin superfamily protein